jgi:predicted lipoprotein with Yx(FWY)xxD motif
VARLPATALVLATLTLAACGEDSDEVSEPASAPETQAQETGATGGQGEQGKDQESQKPGVEIVTGDSQFGEILFDGDEQAIYLFDKETGDRSECYGECAEAWPPVLTDGEPQAGGAVDQKLLGTTERDDGSTQVTYDGQPLYYYVDDPPGQVLCHNVDEFGGLWLVLGADGQALQ